jgi:hypothetical protein
LAGAISDRDEVVSALCQIAVTMGVTVFGGAEGSA